MNIAYRRNWVISPTLNCPCRIIPHPNQKTIAIEPVPNSVMKALNVPWWRALNRAASITRCCPPRYREPSQSSRPNALTEEIPCSDSSTIIFVSASRSCVSRDSCLARRPNQTAVPTTTGVVASTSSVSRGLVMVVSTIPPSNVSNWERNCGIELTSVRWIWSRSAVSRLASSPTRRCAKNTIGRRNSRPNVAIRRSAIVRSPTSVLHTVLPKAQAALRNSTLARTAPRVPSDHDPSPWAASISRPPNQGMANPVALEISRQHHAARNRPR